LAGRDLGSSRRASSRPRPDVTVSTNLGPWVQPPRAWFAPRRSWPIPSRANASRRPSNWDFSPHRPSISSFGIAENNLFILLSALGPVARPFNGERLCCRSATLYDPLHPARPRCAQLCLLSRRAPSSWRRRRPGVTASRPRAAAHQSIATPADRHGAGTGLAAFEPAFVDENSRRSSALRSAISRRDGGRGTRTEHNWLRGRDRPGPRSICGSPPGRSSRSGATMTGGAAPADRRRRLLAARRRGPIARSVIAYTGAGPPPRANESGVWRIAEGSPRTVGFARRPPRPEPAQMRAGPRRRRRPARSAGLVHAPFRISSGCSPAWPPHLRHRHRGSTATRRRSPGSGAVHGHRVAAASGVEHFGQNRDDRGPLPAIYGIDADNHRGRPPPAPHAGPADPPPSRRCRDGWRTQRAHVRRKRLRDESHLDQVMIAPTIAIAHAAHRRHIARSVLSGGRLHQGAGSPSDNR